MEKLRLKMPWTREQQELKARMQAYEIEVFNLKQRLQHWIDVQSEYCLSMQRQQNKKRK